MIKHLYLFLFVLVISTVTGWSQSSISGVIVNGDNQPLIGVNIFAVDENVGTSTDENGAFTLENLNGNSSFLRISYLGYQTLTKEIETQGSQTYADFVLFRTTDQLDEVVISANRYSQDIQKTATSVSAVNAKQIEQLQIKELNELSDIAPNFLTFDDGGTGIFTLISDFK